MILKNIFDYILALILLIFLVGLIVLLIIISSIDTNQFGVFTQKRVGKDGRFFNIYKIRTIKGVSKSTITPDQHQITKIGKILRDYKLDELPQLFNILIGEMSFVGPRPDVAGYADKLVGEDRLMLKVKPGITGWAQINGWRGETDTLDKMQKRVEFDLEYIREWNIWLDLKIIFLTIFKGFVNKSAY